MPELPEVETICNAIRPELVNRSICKIQVFCKKLRYPINIQHQKESLSVIIAIRRRAKYILIELDNQHVILVHLGMTGSLRIESQWNKRKHDHVLFWLDNNMILVYNDSRRFGQIELHPISSQGAIPQLLHHLAPEPFSDDFDIDWMIKVCKGRTKPIKNTLMDNTLVTGVGNIYASETLFLSRIHPERPSFSLSKKEIKTLHKAIIVILLSAIQAGGSSIINYRHPDGSEGLFTRELRVYGQKEETCGDCKTGIIEQIKMAGRSTFFCPVCQK
jgi:formamidopyrimidine-DNA glycosylase